jgi:hypothetical protein
VMSLSSRGLNPFELMFLIIGIISIIVNRPVDLSD